MRSAGVELLPHWYDLGDVAIIPLVELDELVIPFEEFFPGYQVDSDAWYADKLWFDRETRSQVLFVQSFVIVTSEQVTLVDACVGSGRERRRPEFHRLPNRWLERFLATGLRPEDVNEVVFTHLHQDHVGGVCDWDGEQWVPVFPQAPHYVVEEEFRYWSSEAGQCAMHRTGDYIIDSITPIQSIGQLKFVDPQAELSPHVQLVPAFGHTPGNICVAVRGTGGSVTLLGDVIHHPAQIHDPDLSTQYCVSGTAAARVRRQLLADAATTGGVIAPSHFRALSAGRVFPNGTGYTFEPAYDILRPAQFNHQDWLRLQSSRQAEERT